MKILKQFRAIGISLIRAIKYRNSQKVFCIGRNKTGTTSMAELFLNLGLCVAPQRPAELLIKDWARDDFKRLIKFVKYSGNAFQDVPFSLPNTFKILDREFPNSKFILTIRDSSEEWYKSFKNSHAKLFGNGVISTKQDLQNADYVYKGWMWEMYQDIYKPLNDDIYNRDLLKRHYSDYNASVIDFFKNNPNRLLVINLKNENAANEICKFLGFNKSVEILPWKNRTKNIQLNR